MRWFEPARAQRATAWACACAAALAAAGCASTSVPAQAPAVAQADPARLVATVRAAAGSGDGELAVAPLRDPMVEDLREQANAFERAGQYAQSAAALDQALGIVPDDPAVLQERAEAALLQRDFAGAEQRARRAFDLGAKVGPLCRRHWATVRAARYAANDGAGAAQAQQAFDACKVAAVERF